MTNSKIEKILNITNEKQQKQYLKNIIISEKWKITKAKRTNQVCKTYETKIIKNKLSKTQDKLIKDILLECKWMYNYTVAWLNDLYKNAEKIEETFKVKDKVEYNKSIKLFFQEVTKIKEVPVKIGEVFEVREIKNIPSAIKQEVISQMKSNIKSIISNKKWGKLKFKSFLSTLPFKQYWNSHFVINDNQIHLSKIWTVRVRWLDQIKDEVEYTTAKLTRKASWYYINLTTFAEKDTTLSHKKWAVWLDFWIESQITTSDWIQFKFQIPEDKKVRRRAKILSKKRIRNKKKKSNNYFKMVNSLKKAHEKVVNRRKNIWKKIVSFLKNNYSKIIVQDEQIANWHKSGLKGFWRKIQHSSVGRIIADIKNIGTTIELDKFFPSSKIMSCCWHRKDNLTLSDRVVVCDNCGMLHNRDHNSAINIHNEGTKEKLPLEQGFKLLEIKTSDLLSNISLLSLVNEGRNLAF